jgi:hypothetical protein
MNIRLLGGEMAKVRSIMLCDDIRREDSGKELLIGVYSGGIRFFGQGPGKLRQLFFRVEMEQEGEQLDAVFSLELMAPSGAQLMNVQDRKIKITKGGRGAIFLSHLDMVFYEQGTYAIRVVADGQVYEDTVDVSFEPAKTVN